MLKKILYGLVIALPLAVLMIFGGYLFYHSWVDYQADSKLLKELNDIKLLQSAEHSFFNELVCVSTLRNNADTIEKVCSKMQRTTDGFLAQMKQKKFDSKRYAFQNDIESIRTKMKEGGDTPLKLLLNGKVDKGIQGYMQHYIGNTKRKLQKSEDKAHLELYAELNKITYASEAEKALVAYYLSNHLPIASEYLIFWDKLISGEKFDSAIFQQYRLYRDMLQKKWEAEPVQKILRKIEDIRFDLMSHASSGLYQSSLLEWIALSNDKHKVLMQMENEIIKHTAASIQERLNKSRLQMIFTALAALLSLIALILTVRIFILAYRDEKRFGLLTDKIQNLTETPEVSLDDKEIAYNFIENSYETLYQSNEVLQEEKRKKNQLFSNMFYKLQKPVDTLLGYTQLMKEISLTTEQRDFINHIDESTQQLEEIVKETPKQLDMGKVMAFEIRERIFDIIKKTESAVDLFVSVAAQKDINLSLYTDPSLPHQVLGDDIRIYEVLNHLIDNAVENTHTYGNIDISVKKVLEDEKTTVVRFVVKNGCVGYTKEEVKVLQERLNSSDDSFASENIKEQMLYISASILKQMGSKLEIESIKGESLSYAFTLRLPKANDQKELPSVRFEGMHIGIALPSLDIQRQQERNIEAYVKALGAECKLYDYESIIKPEKRADLPDLMIVYHHYARLEGELETFMGFDCNVALVTTPSLRSRIDLNKYHFSSIVYDPVTYHKVLRMLAESKLGAKRLDREQPAKTEQTAEQTDEKSEAESTEHFKGLRVLLAEDNEINQKLWRERFASLGVDATIVSNGKEVFDKRRENDFDLIFMDIDMPLMDGFESTNKILYYERINQLPHIPIIGLVSSSDEKEKYIKLGMDEIYLKSSSDERLKQILETFGIEMAMKRSESEEDELIAKVLSEDFIKL